MQQRPCKQIQKKKWDKYCFPLSLKKQIDNRNFQQQGQSKKPPGAHWDFFLFFLFFQIKKPAIPTKATIAITINQILDFAFSARVGSGERSSNNCNIYFVLKIFYPFPIKKKTIEMVFAKNAAKAAFQMFGCNKKYKAIASKTMIAT